MSSLAWPVGATLPAHASWCACLQMKGCEAYLALCKEGSAVAACKNPGVAPNVMWTYETKDQVDVSAG